MGISNAELFYLVTLILGSNVSIIDYINSTLYPFPLSCVTVVSAKEDMCDCKCSGLYKIGKPYCTFLQESLIRGEQTLNSLLHETP